MKQTRVRYVNRSHLCQEGSGSGFGGFAEEDDGWTASPEPDIPLQVPGTILIQETSVSDPYSIDTDPDPAF